jgi:hypothetical protein
VDDILNFTEDNFPDERDNVLFADGLEKAFLGIATGKDVVPKACYDYDRCIEILQDDGMSYEEAEEYFSFNVIDAYMGEYTPIFLKRYEGRI